MSGNPDNSRSWSFFTCHKLPKQPEQFKCRGWLAKHETKEEEHEDKGFLKKRTSQHYDYVWALNGKYTREELEDFRRRFGDDAIEIDE